MKPRPFRSKATRVDHIRGTFFRNIVAILSINGWTYQVSYPEYQIQTLCPAPQRLMQLHLLVSVMLLSHKTKFTLNMYVRP